ncbi:MAG: MarR family winged helix-turn-helix transcriptional regulator [Acetatifactor sp.]
MNSILENLYTNRELHSVLFDSICTKYRLTHTEMLVLLFLRENVPCDTATDIVEKLKITKSHVSASVRDLEERGYLKGNYEGHNRRTIHLQLCDNASEIVRAGETAQNEFLSILCQGFSEEEKSRLQSYVQRMTENANRYLNGQNDRGEKQT